MVGIISKDDTAWLVFPYSSSFEAYSSSYEVGLLVRKRNHIVNITGVFKPTAAISGSGDRTQIISSALPSGYEPISPVRVLSGAGGSGLWLCTIDTDGTVGFSRYRTSSSYISCSTSTQLFLSVMYMTAN